MTEYPLDSTVTFEGKQWRVISTYFELRKLQQVGTETYRTVTVEALNAQPNPFTRKAVAMTIDNKPLDETPLSPYGMQITDHSEPDNPSRLRIDSFLGDVEIYMTDRYSVFSITVTPQIARGIALGLERLADAIEGKVKP